MVALTSPAGTAVEVSAELAEKLTKQGWVSAEKPKVVEAKPQLKKSGKSDKK